MKLDDLATIKLSSARLIDLCDGQFSPWEVDLRREPARSPCTSLLSELAPLLESLDAKLAPRSYRAGFTKSYQCLCPPGTLNYRIDILEPAVHEQRPRVLYVNDECFHLSHEVDELASTLAASFAVLVNTLQRICDQISTKGSSIRVFGRSNSSRGALTSECLNCMIRFDGAYAKFEERYINELINIEEKARSVLLEAVKWSRSMRNLEDEAQRTQGFRARNQVYCESEMRLVECIARMNACANHRGKGRDDLTVSILTAARAAMNTCRGSTTYAARMLAQDVIKTFEAFQDYFLTLEHQIEKVDPQLSGNKGLVSRLVDWEEHWQLGMKFLVDRGVRDDLCDILAQCWSAQSVMPEFLSMVEDCGVELFLVIPRIVWLRFALKPERQTAFIRSLLPHEFAQARGKGSEKAPWLFSKNLQELLDQMQVLRQLVMASLPGLPDSESVEAALWALLVRRAVEGCADNDGPIYAVSAMQVATEDFMRLVEARSMELQRHQALDWNQCVSLLVRCLSCAEESTPDSRHADI